MRIEHYLKTFCDCGVELRSAEEWSQHRRKHFLERCFADPEMRRTMQWLRDAGFKDQQDQVGGEHG